MATKYVRTIMCGCGNCHLRKNVEDTCPQWNSKDAIQLWCSDFSSTEAETEAELLMEELASIAEELEGEPLECH